jgi:hypothetical protein
MKIYIVWKTNCDNFENYSHIIGIYKNINTALSKCNKFNKNNGNNKKFITKEKGIKVSNGTLLYEYNDISVKDISYCTEFDVNDYATELFFIKISESGAGQSYHEYRWIYTCDNKKDVIEIANDYFCEEHNRDNECKECINNKCNQEFINELTQINKTSITCTDYEGSSFEIWNVVIE